MNEQLKVYLEDVQTEILIEAGQYPDLDKERFFSQLADWAYSRYEYLTHKISKQC